MKFPKIKQANVTELYDAYETMDLTEFRSFVTKLVLSAAIPNHQILSNITEMSKEQLLLAANNFAMKGWGHGVIG